MNYKIKKGKAIYRKFDDSWICTVSSENCFGDCYITHGKTQQEARDKALKNILEEGDMHLVVKIT